MKSVIAMFDDFFDSPNEIFDRITACPHGEYQSIWDGVKYPGINEVVPIDIQEFIHQRLQEITDRKISIACTFSRAMLDGMVAPHRIHSDKIMGQYSMHIYLSKEWPAESGTSFWTHKTEGNRHTHKTDVNIVDHDHDQFDQWTRNIVMLGKFNRAVIHDATLFHCAEPGIGWGKGPKDGRLVLTTFFSEAK